MGRIRLATTLVLMLVAAASTSAAAPGPFAALAGVWFGNGHVNMASGAREGLRCRAQYDVAGEGSTLRLELQCASDSYKFTLAGEATARGDGINGSWSESSRNVAGVLEGRIVGERIEAIVRGATFAANIALSTRGKRQSVTIAPQGVTEVTTVSVTLNKQ